MEQFIATAQQRQLSLAGTFGVFYYRSASIDTLEFLARVLPVPAAHLTAEFEAGLTAVQICARSVAMLRQLGVKNIYGSNLPVIATAPTQKAILFKAAQSTGRIL